ncbi:MAG: phosphatidylserine decarboxylase family protein [Bacteroidetes bacterium]|nr:phosphatidylserine decarboxylase family protein [Bacteroidota bacterium]MBX7044292.1 phosphatidylserine decarboxylase family protein [Ignavibacteria bacterium]
MVIICSLIFIAALFIPVFIAKVILLLLVIFLMSFTFYFFRDPERKIPDNYDDSMILAPGDGKICLIEDIINKEDNLYPKGEALKQVSIFLSPLNVHVNRNPTNGTVKYYKYIEGEYLVAFDHKSSDRNERTEIGIEDYKGRKVLFKQIAGFVARRIVCDLDEGDSVKAGERFGMIKFGSRVDILLKPDAEIKVKLNDIVKGAETVIAINK